MSDLFKFADELEESLEDEVIDAPPPSPPKPNVLTVSELSNALRHAVESTFGQVAVEGEVSSLRVPSSGHMYFTLKDDNNVLKSIIWRSAAGRLKTKIEEGMQVVAYGQLTTYGARSEYQIVINRIEPAGLGALMQRFEELKQKLANEGLFDESRKKPIPYLPENIGIVTSPTGAVIGDMVHRFEARCPRNIYLWPVLVQGPGAKEQIAEAVKGFNVLSKDGGPVPRPDVIIVARGGGSLEDLWAFNEEIVVRAVAESDIPVISGVGHEPDFTLCDFAADVRAPTPTAAAELAVPVREDLIATLALYRSRIGRGVTNTIERYKKQVELYRKALPDPSKEVTQTRLRLEDRRERLEGAMQNFIRRKQERIENVNKLLASYSPHGPLERGYTYLTGADGKTLVKSAQTSEHQVTVHFKDGTREAVLDKKKG